MKKPQMEPIERVEEETRRNLMSDIRSTGLLQIDRFKDFDEFLMSLGSMQSIYRDIVLTGENDQLIEIILRKYDLRYWH